MSGRQPAPRIEPGTLLRLAPDDWTAGSDLTPGRYVDVVLARVRADPAQPVDGEVWVHGHRPECEYPHIDPHPPCIELRIKAAALSRHAPTS